MLPFAEARQRIVDAAEPLPQEDVALDRALDRVLARDIIAARNLPGFDYSAMDGYALDSAEFGDKAPCTMPVAGESRAGHGFGELVPATACRIFTGAPLPRGADCVIAQEDASREGAEVTFVVKPAAGAHVRHEGEDLAIGARALTRGTQLGPHQLALLAALGLPNVPVHRQPVVHLLATGDELRSVESADRPGSVIESNSHAIRALVEKTGGRFEFAAVLPDELGVIQAAIEKSLATADVVITVGGVSVGDHDVVKQALLAARVELDFWKVRIRPGKPLAFGRHGSSLVLGLPGNPASAQLTFSLFGLPLLRKLLGHNRLFPSFEHATLERDLPQSPGRLGFYRAELIETASGLQVRPFDNQSSGSVVSLARADALIVVAEESSGEKAGSNVAILRLDRL